MRRTLVAVLAILLPAAVVRAELTPAEVAILAVRSSAQSRELAEYYALKRHIPKEQICLLDVEAGETVSRNDWETRIRPSIRNWLVSNQLDRKIRCFVTTWDVPLKIGPVDTSHPTVALIQNQLESSRTLRQERIRRLAGEIDGLLPDDQRPERDVPAGDAPHKQFVEFLEAASKDAQIRLRKGQEQNSPAVQGYVNQLERLYTEGGGVTAIMRSLQIQMQNNPQPPIKVQRMFEFHRGEMIGLRAGINVITSARESVERDLQTMALIQQSDGLLGTLAWIEQTRELWQKNETYSSFDSELALLHFPPYGLLRWQASPWHYSFPPTSRELLPPALMVARLEAPTFEQARRLIDVALETEQTGLSGKVYLDARGIPPEKVSAPGSYADFDQSLRDLAKLLKEHTSLVVILDDKSELFQRGECPDAALYCGWYSLAEYVDAFDWRPGSVGYHLASGEAKTLRQPSSNVWCKRMLESGVAATLGPTFEPYLTSFPRPLDFFPLLLTGQLTLAETYAATNPFSSWVMVLVGDPLYNPFRNAPQIERRDLPVHLQRLVPEQP
jgi:uncharacterized protein (TIGR03790 family)